MQCEHLITSCYRLAILHYGFCFASVVHSFHGNWKLSTAKNWKNQSLLGIFFSISGCIQLQLFHSSNFHSNYSRINIRLYCIEMFSWSILFWLVLFLFCFLLLLFWHTPHLCDAKLAFVRYGMHTYRQSKRHTWYRDGIVPYSINIHKWQSNRTRIDRRAVLSFVLPLIKISTCTHPLDSCVGCMCVFCRSCGFKCNWACNLCNVLHSHVNVSQTTIVFASVENWPIEFKITNTQ